MIKLYRGAFFVALVAILILSLTPGDSLPGVGVSDKIQHLTAYAVLGALAILGYRKTPWTRVALALIVLGASVELAQSFVPGRHSEWLDGLANAIGTMIGLGLGFGATRNSP